ncbi:hypothetical protein cyc_05759 [Cyclospora cayetanensis]|uniref:Transmembrane protein n=1 Tax=Cyclospora cayetanensis TaxID=88456 RepID=A0A1D3D104_9EIME|nr:hypothetical protein cyc_05759 [Cyclospora cayetanensis]
MRRSRLLRALTYVPLTLWVLQYAASNASEDPALYEELLKIGDSRSEQETPASAPESVPTEDKTKTAANMLTSNRLGEAAGDSEPQLPPGTHVAEEKVTSAAGTGLKGEEDEAVNTRSPMQVGLLDEASEDSDPVKRVLGMASVADEEREPEDTPKTAEVSALPQPATSAQVPARSEFIPQTVLDLEKYGTGGAPDDEDMNSDDGSLNTRGIELDEAVGVYSTEESSEESSDSDSSTASSSASLSKDERPRVVGGLESSEQLGASSVVNEASAIEQTYIDISSSLRPLKLPFTLVTPLYPKVLTFKVLDLTDGAASALSSGSISVTCSSQSGRLRFTMHPSGWDDSKVPGLFQKFFGEALLPITVERVMPVDCDCRRLVKLHENPAYAVAANQQGDIDTIFVRCAPPVYARFALWSGPMCKVPKVVEELPTPVDIPGTVRTVGKCLFRVVAASFYTLWASHSVLQIGWNLGNGEAPAPVLFVDLTKQAEDGENCKLRNPRDLQLFITDAAIKTKDTAIPGRALYFSTRHIPSFPWGGDTDSPPGASAGPEPFISLFQVPFQQISEIIAASQTVHEQRWQ